MRTKDTTGEETIEIFAVKLVNATMLLVDFSDGTSAFFSARQLAKLATNRMETGNWPRES